MQTIIKHKTILQCTNGMIPQNSFFFQILHVISIYSIRKIVFAKLGQHKLIQR